MTAAPGSETATSTQETSMVRAPISSFASSFKLYGIGLGVIVAAVPLLTQADALIPSYRAVEGSLSFFTTLVSFLTVALLFGLRRLIGASVFPQRRFLSKQEMTWRNWMVIWIPAAFVAGSLLSVVFYLMAVASSVEKAALMFARTENGTGPPLVEALEDRDIGTTLEARLFRDPSAAALVLGKVVGKEVDDKTVPAKEVVFQSEAGIELVLASTPSFEIPRRDLIQILYVLMFLGATSAFVWFGLIEYVQQELGIRDQELLREPYRAAEAHRFRIPEVLDLESEPRPVHFELGYSPDPVQLVEGPTGPVCTVHRVVLEYQGPAMQQERHVWGCLVREDNKTRLLHTVTLAQDAVDIERLANGAVQAEIDELGRRGAGEAPIQAEPAPVA